jgi:peptidoglycan/LPS O-acetylase OafA/YrhL
MRGVAALLILVRHNDIYFGKFRFNESFLAVDLFFVLSGFVVAGAYSERLRQGLNWRSFMLLRLVRFYPLYLLGTLLGLAAMLGGMLFGRVGEQVTYAEIGASLTLNVFFIPSFFMRDLFPLLTVAWSLFWELLVNFAYSQVWPSLSRKRLLALLACSALSLILAATRCVVDSGSAPGLDSAWMAATRVVFSFGMGLLLQRMPKADFRVPPVLLLGASAIALGFNPQGDFRPLYEICFILLISPALVYLGAASEPKNGLEARLYAFLGAVSYALYVLHKPIGLLLSIAFKHLVHVGVAHFAPWSGLVLIAVLLAICGILDRYYDGPARRWLLTKV